MTFTWVIGTFRGARAISVKQHADAGIGYFVREENNGRGNTYEVEAAYRRPNDSPVPEHLIVADAYQIQKLEALYEARHSLRRS